MVKMALSFILLLILAGMIAAKHIPCKVQCERREKVQHFGFDIAKKPLLIDVGECHTTLLNKTEEGCRINNEHMCIKRCIPRSREYLEASNRDGPIRVPVIRSCYPTYHHCLEDCELKPHVLYLFPDSKYQTRVDVKKCSGQCSDEASDHSCVPTSVSTKAVDGPNGPVTLSIIDKCQCKNSVCYRQDYYQSHWNYTRCSNVTATKTEKVINVGRCVGSCEGVELPGRCYPSPTRCLLYIPSGPAKCVPTTYSRDNYYDSDMNENSVPVIEECGCTSG